MGMAVGYPLGVVLSTQVFSRVFKYRDSMRLAPLGAAMGVVLIFGLAEPSNLDTNASVLLSSYFLVTALLATWGFHLKKV
jgi:hypothetical protein